MHSIPTRAHVLCHPCPSDTSWRVHSGRPLPVWSQCWRPSLPHLSPCYVLTDILAKQHGLLAAQVVLPTRNQVGNGARTFRVQPIEEVVFTVDTQCLCFDGKCHHLQIGECGYDTTRGDISFLIYLISCKFPANLKKNPNFVTKLRISTIIVLNGLDTTNVLKINDMCNFLSINVLQI